MYSEKGGHVQIPNMTIISNKEVISDLKEEEDDDDGLTVEVFTGTDEEEAWTELFIFRFSSFEHATSSSP